MIEISVGQVAGAISFGILIIQLSIPLLLVVVLIGFLQDEHNAVTWSVIGGIVHSTLWPTIVRGDAATSLRHGVSTGVILVAYLGTIGATLTAIASVVTPLGLSEEIRPGAVIKVTTFDYARDESLFGRKTQSRDDYVFSRTCGVYSNKTCPGGTNAFIWNNHEEYNWVTNNTAYYSLFEIACNETFHSRNATAIIECLNDPIIFENVTAIDTSSLDTIPSRRKLYDPVVSKDVQRQFSSSADTDWDLRARAFDIEFRTYRTVPARNDSYLNTTGDFVTLESLLFEQGPQLREGLIIDPINGGIGFRNHTVPTEPSLRAYGAQWKEDILWIEPETFCSDTLLTYQQTYENTPATTPSYYFPESRMLIDRGAFFRTLNLTQPVINQSDPYSSPQLEARSLSAAIRFGAMIMQDLKVNINNSTVGQGHNLDQSKFGNTLPSQGLDYMYYGRFPLPSWCGDYEHNETSVCTEFESNIVLNDCGELQPDDKPSINRPAVLCGFLMPPPKLKKQLAGGLSMSEATIYTCASTLRATVKEVSLSYISRASTGTPPSLADLSVIDIKPKRYSSEKSKPLWGVENPGTLWKASEIQLLWGIISEEFENSSNLQTIRSEHLYLPGFFPENDKPGDSVGTRGPIYAWHLALPQYSDAGVVPTDFIGIGDVRYDSLWRRLSLSREGAARIPGLVWTDVAAAMLVGTRSASNYLPAGGVEVQRLERKILYDVRFAIPAIIVLIFWTCALAVSIYRIVVSGVSLTKIKNVINQVSTGRALSSTTSINETELVSSTSTWVGTVGQIRFRLPLNGEEKNDGGNSV